MSQISDTAFLVNWSKAKNADLSKDPWAHLWVTEKAIHFAKEFTAKVSRHHPIVPALRNRYFVDAIQRFEKKVGSFTFINIASGFTSYPYLIGEENPVYEIELPGVIAYKKEKLRQFEKEKNIPKREIHFLSLDLNDPTALSQIETIIAQQQHQPCFILMEGILYYLKKSVVEALFSLFETKLASQSQLGFVTWSPEIQNSPTMIALKNYFETELHFPKQEYTWLNRIFFEQWNGLHCLEETNYMKLEKKYCPHPEIISADNIVNESVFLFKKT